MTQNILVIGATSAIAEATLRIWAKAGHRLHCIGRRESALQSIQSHLLALGAAAVSHETADLDQLDALPGLIDRAHATLGRFDIVLIAHGTLPDQAACESGPTPLLAAFHTNALSTMVLCHAIASRLELQRSGVLAVISSVAGDRGRQSNYVYGAAKGALSLFLQGLRNRLFRHGAHVLTIKPGFVDTPMTASFSKGPLWASPPTIARGIIRAVDKRKNTAYLPGFWWAIMTLIRLMPEAIFKRMRL